MNHVNLRNFSKMGHMVTEKIGSDWKRDITGDYNCPISFPDIPEYPTVYTKEDHPYWKDVWERRLKIVEKAWEIGFHEIDSVPKDKCNMKWKYIVFLGPLDEEDIDGEKNHIMLDTYYNVVMQMRKTSLIGDIPCNSIKVEVVEWDTSDRQFLIGGVFNGYEAEDLVIEIAKLHKRILELKSLFVKMDYIP